MGPFPKRRGVGKLCPRRPGGGVNPRDRAASSIDSEITRLALQICKQYKLKQSGKNY